MSLEAGEAADQMQEEEDGREEGPGSTRLDTRARVPYFRQQFPSACQETELSARFSSHIKQIICFDEPKKTVAIFKAAKLAFYHFFVSC